MDHRDLDSVETAKNEIIDQIRSLEKDSSDLETPISVSLDLQLPGQSERPEERSLADLVSAVVDLRTSLSNLEARIRDQRAAGHARPNSGRASQPAWASGRIFRCW